MKKQIFDAKSIRYLLLVIESENWEKLHLRCINTHHWDLLAAWKVNQTSINANRYFLPSSDQAS